MPKIVIIPTLSAFGRIFTHAHLRKHRHRAASRSSVAPTASCYSHPNHFRPVSEIVYRSLIVSWQQHSSQLLSCLRPGWLIPELQVSSGKCICRLGLLYNTCGREVGVNAVLMRPPFIWIVVTLHRMCWASWSRDEGWCHNYRCHLTLCSSQSTSQGLTSPHVISQGAEISFHCEKILDFWIYQTMTVPFLCQRAKTPARSNSNSNWFFIHMVSCLIQFSLCAQI